MQWQFWMHISLLDSGTTYQTGGKIMRIVYDDAKQSVMVEAVL